MIRQVDIKHILLFKSFDNSALFRDGLEKSIELANQWWLSKGVQIVAPDIQVRVGHDINLYTDNPWYEVRNWLSGEGGYNLSELYIVHLYGWYSSNYLGWGGVPLAVVGDWTINALASLGTPEAIVDDWDAGYIIMHEQGHAMGLSHDFTTPCAVMGYHWCRYNSIMGEISERQLRQQPLINPNTPPQPRIYKCRVHKYIKRAHS